MQIGNNTATPVSLPGGVNVANGATLVFYTTASGTAAAVSGSGTITDSGTGVVTVYQPASFSGTIGAVNGSSGTTLVLSGDPTACTTINNTLNTSGQNVKFKNGIWNLGSGGGYGSNLEVDGGLVIRPVNTGDFFNVYLFRHHGCGTFESLNQYGMRMGSTFGPQDNSGQTTVCIQSGGLVTVSGNAASIGSSTQNIAESFTITGGTFNLTNGNNFGVGAGTLRHGSHHVIAGWNGKNSSSMGERFTDLKAMGRGRFSGSQAARSRRAR